MYHNGRESVPTNIALSCSAALSLISSISSVLPLANRLGSRDAQTRPPEHAPAGCRCLECVQEARYHSRPHRGEPPRRGFSTPSLRLKAGNAYLTFSTSTGTFLRSACLVDANVLKGLKRSCSISENDSLNAISKVVQKKSLDRLLLEPSANLPLTPLHFRLTISVVLEKTAEQQTLGGYQMQTTPADPGALTTSLRGRWTIIYQEVDGQMLPPTYNLHHTLELQGNSFKVEINGSVFYDGTFTINTASLPYQVALTYNTSANPTFLTGPRPGVFQLEGDTLKWCFSLPGRAAPTALNTTPNSDLVLTILHRHHAATDVAVVSLASTRLIAW
jgi:uncharacterized protein (TIGR03067 family)